MKKFGLIGKTLKHSYSKIIHNKLGDYPYELYELDECEIKDFTQSDVDGFNVTIPYKKEIIQYLDVIDEFAQKIGAVNTVVKRDGKVYGFNTDFKGMEYMLKRANISLKDKSVMILGSGGTSNTAKAVSEYLGAKSVVVVSRSGAVNYQNCYDLSGVEIIINTTPVGMYPNVENSPVDISKFSSLVGVVDAIYNPSLTNLLYQAKERGINYTSGLPMLVSQAKYARDYFFNETTSDDDIERVLSEINKETKNVVLIGMPGSGKSTVGNILSNKLDRKFIDTDKAIEEKDGRSIPQIFSESGEEYFRKLESEILFEVGKMNGVIIATGGGVVKNKDNYFPLKCNGEIVYINRSVEKLSTEGRPLSKDLKAVEKLYSERKNLYSAFADFTVDNDGEVEDTVKNIMEKL